MAVMHAIWKVGAQPTPLTSSSLDTERQLEDMIVSSPAILSDQWMLIGRQVETGFGGRIDLLAMAPDGGLILIELKRDKTPREVVAQSIDYATFVERLKPEGVSRIYSKFAPNRDLLTDFRQKFGQTLEEEMINSTHQIVIVASELDDSTERIIRYLGDREISINILCFQVFDNGAEKLLSRAWLLDPVQVQVTPSGSGETQKEPWNGELYASFGHSESRSWDEAVKYGFISAGGGSWYSNSLNLLNLGDRVWVKAPSYGFVGVGIVLGKPVRASEFLLQTEDGEKPALEVLKGGTYHREYADDPEKSEYFVPVKWLSTLPLEKAVKGVGLFGNQNTVCKPTVPKWRMTIERLKEAFPDLSGI